MCYNQFCEEGTFGITVLSFDAVFGLAAVLNQRRISGLGAAAGRLLTTVAICLVTFSESVKKK